MASQDRNDYMRKIDPAPRWLTDTRSTAEIERDIRAALRKAVAGELRYMPRGNRGVGKTRPDLLDRIRQLRAQHTASIARERADAAAARWRAGLTVPVIKDAA